MFEVDLRFGLRPSPQASMNLAIGEWVVVVAREG